MSYVLITPLVNEEKNLLNLKNTVLNQTLRPVLWIIVDGGSDDDSFNLATKIFKNYDWIEVVHQKKFYEKTLGHLNFAEAINEGYTALKKISQEKKVNYEYVGKTDATPILCENYFQTLLSKMKFNKELAITCGIQEVFTSNNRIKLEPLENIPLSGFNDMRLYRKDFFEEIKGYPLTPSPDSVLLIKAVEKGYKVKVIQEISFLKPRLGGSKIGFWNGFKLKGKNMYILGYHPFLALINALQVSRKIPPHYQFIPMLWGFLLSILKRENKIPDLEIREYYGKKRLKEIMYGFKG